MSYAFRKQGGKRKTDERQQGEKKEKEGQHKEGRESRKDIKYKVRSNVIYRTPVHNESYHIG